MLLLIVLGFANSYLNKVEFELLSNRLGNIHRIEGELSKLKTTTKYNRYHLKVNNITTETGTVKTPFDFKLLIYVNNDPVNNDDLTSRNIVIHNPEINRITPDEKGFYKWMERNAIAGLLWTTPNSIELIHNDNVSFFKLYQNQLSEQLDRLFQTEESNAIAKALLLGDKSGLSKTLRETYTKSGAIHILTVSGLHATMIFAIPFFILGKLRLESKIRYITSLSTVFFFTMICGAAPSLLRALLMLSLYTIAKLSKRKTNKYNILCGCAFILVVYDPSIIHNISFQLSFSAVYGIMAFYKRVQQVWKPRKKLWIYTRDMLAVSVAAQTGTLGFSLFHFGQFPLGFLFSTLVVIPLAPLLIALLLTCLFISFLSIDLAQLVTEVIDFILCIQNHSLTLISNQKFLYINNIPFSKIELLAYYTLLIVINSHRRVYNWTSISLMILFSTWIAINENKQLKDLKVDLHRDRIGYILKTYLYGEPIEHRIVLPINTESKLDHVDYCVENKKSP